VVPSPQSSPARLVRPERRSAQPRLPGGPCTCRYPDGQNRGAPQQTSRANSGSADQPADQRAGGGGTSTEKPRPSALPRVRPIAVLFLVERVPPPPSSSPSLQDLGPVLGPLGSAACRLSVWGPKIFPLGSQIQRHVQSSRHVPIERKHSNDARGLGMLLID
jgi:hypothetical protein